MSANAAAVGEPHGQLAVLRYRQAVRTRGGLLARGCRPGLQAAPVVGGAGAGQAQRRQACQSVECRSSKASRVHVAFAVF